MPMYEYQCKGCKHVFEKYASGRKGGAEKGGACPRCGKTDTAKVFSTFASCQGSAGSGGGSCGSGGFS